MLKPLVLSSSSITLSAGFDVLAMFINLVARSLQFSKDPEALEEKLTQAHDIELWRKRGPLGKIRNIVTWIRASPQRREQLRNY
jgi:hypothetical protein